MCWISVATQKPKEGEKVDVWFVDADFPVGVRLSDIAYLPTKLPMIWNFATHWRYPPAPPAEYANAAKGN